MRNIATVLLPFTILLLVNLGIVYKDRCQCIQVTQDQAEQVIILLPHAIPHMTMEQVEVTLPSERSTVSHATPSQSNSHLRLRIQPSIKPKKRFAFQSHAASLSAIDHFGIQPKLNGVQRAEKRLR